MTDKHALRRTRWQARLLPTAQLGGLAGALTGLTALTSWPWACIGGGLALTAYATLREAGWI